MNDRYARVKEILLAVSELPAAERAAYLEEACAGDAGLRAEVESLLAHETDTPSIVEPIRFRKMIAPWADELDDEPDPEGVGPYRILERLGEGGMGVVYRAEQTEPLKRTVALKLVRGGMDSRRVVARFEAERQTLALMDHPNIAKVLDAGESEGRPYFVMELVEGAPLTVYADRERLSVRERLALFIDVCHGVQHAHQKGVIHRDLKPQNLLVTRVDGHPVPKVIDFGIAKATQGTGASGDSMLTQAGQFVGTPEYMSPEQAGLSGSGVDTRTDVYALGVVLYELLSGHRPFPFDPGESPMHFQRRLLEEDPPRPSTRLAKSDEALDAARARGVDLGGLRRLLRQDLDWIVLKALARNPADRYPSVSELGADVGRYLDDRPVIAGRPGPGYQLRKFVARHRVAVAAAAVVAAALVLGAAGTAWQAIRATRAQHRAEARLADIQAFANSMLFGVHDRIADLPESTPAREYIVQTARDYLDRIAADPQSEERLRGSLANAYSQLGKVQTDLGQSHAALESHLRALELFGAQAVEHPEDLGARGGLARQHNEVAISHGRLGAIDSSYTHHHIAAEQLTGLLEVAPDSIAFAQELAEAQMRLSYVCVRSGRAGEAEGHARAAVEFREAYAAAHPDDPEAQLGVAWALAFLGEALAEFKRDQAALDVYERSVAIFREQHEEDTQNAGLLQRLGIILGAVSGQQTILGRYEDAAASARQSLEVRTRRARLQPRNVRAQIDLARGHDTLGRALLELEAWGDAAREFETGRAICERLADEDPENTFISKDLVAFHLCLADAALGSGETARAMEHLDRAETRNRALLELEADKVQHHESEVMALTTRGDVWRYRAMHGDGSADTAWSSAHAAYAAAGAAMDRMRERDLVSPLTESTLVGWERGLAAADSALAAR